MKNKMKNKTNKWSEYKNNSDDNKTILEINSINKQLETETEDIKWEMCLLELIGNGSDRTNKMCKKIH